MPNSTESHYVFKSPFASSIYPISSPDETLSLLHELNASRPLEKRLPVEILLYVNGELHTNVVLEDIRATWTPITTSDSFYYNVAVGSLAVALNVDARRYYITGKPSIRPYGTWQDTSTEGLYCQISSADFLYRLRCYFPKVLIHLFTSGHKPCWEVLIKHNQSGLFLFFSGEEAGADVLVCEVRGMSAYCSTYEEDSDKRKQEALLDGLCRDSVRLLNALFFEAADWNHRQFAYYHPAAYADFPTNDSDQHYIVVPTKVLQPPAHEDERVYTRWRSERTPATDVSSFSSLLQDLKYDITSRKVDRLNGTANLTAVIPSALLWYRLICEYMSDDRKLGNVNEEPPITSVWQVQLAHHETKASIIFMDDHGLFDIRGSDGIKEVMGDVEALVELLCSDTWVYLSLWRSQHYHYI